VFARVLREKFLELAAQSKQNQTERNKVHKYLPTHTSINTCLCVFLCVFLSVCVCVSWSVGKVIKVAAQIERAAITVRQIDGVSKREALQSMHQ